MDERAFRCSIAPITYERKSLAVVQYYARSAAFTSEPGQHRISRRIGTQLCGEQEIQEARRHEAEED